MVYELVFASSLQIAYSETAASEIQSYDTGHYLLQCPEIGKGCDSKDSLCPLGSSS